MTVEREKKTPFGGHKGPHSGNQITNKGGKLRNPMVGHYLYLSPIG